MMNCKYSSSPSAHLPTYFFSCAAAFHGFLHTICYMVHSTQLRMEQSGGETRAFALSSDH
jgi:hypothetical protein